MTPPAHQCPFTLSEYRALLQIAKQRYRFCDFEDFDREGANRILWRHDLEYSLQEMDSLAQIDSQEAIVSVIFVQLRSPFYNALSIRARKLFAGWMANGL